LTSEMSKKEFIDCANVRLKELNDQVASARKDNEVKPIVQFGWLRIWIQKIAMYGILIGLVINEVWPRVKHLI